MEILGTSRDSFEAPEWTEYAHYLFVKGLEARGFNVLEGRSVQQMFNTIATVPEDPESALILIQKTGIVTQQEAELAAKRWRPRTGVWPPFNDFDDAAYRSYVSIPLGSPSFDRKHPTLRVPPSRDEITRRQRELVHKLGADASIELIFRFFPNRQPTVQDQSKDSDRSSITPSRLPTTAAVQLDLLVHDQSIQVVWAFSGSAHSPGTHDPRDPAWNSVMQCTIQGLIQAIFERFDRELSNRRNMPSR